mmetsp:Transcript_48502/g.115322  ORF Transcript_48502/g.115322 Transcript_48502/m.115322 type:complete len:427 (-) Transcript_48502:188-1468(-)
MAASAAAAVEGLAFPDSTKEYIITKLDPILEQMVQDVLDNMPEKPVPHMIEWLRKRYTGEVPAARMSILQHNEALKKELVNFESFVSEANTLRASVAEGKASSSNKEGEGAEENEDEGSEFEESDDDGPDEIPLPPKGYGQHQRQSVSAEAHGAFNKKMAFEPPVHDKTDAEKERLSSILKKSFLFSSLDEKELDVILMATERVDFEAGATIIKEGDDGDCLYIIEEGAPECKKLINGENKVVKVCAPGDVFGELALLYNARRAASVEAPERSLCWRLDRETFNHIVKDSASKRTQTYEGFLGNVSLLSGMSEKERSQLSDVLKQETYNKDDVIVKQDDQGNSFYIVEQGTLAALKRDGEGNEKRVKEYSVGDYFGELALLKDQPRAASVVVTSELAKVLALDRKSFKKMMGPLQNYLDEHADEYK